MSSSFLDYLDNGNYVNDKNLDVQNIKVESATTGLVLVADATKKLVSTNFGTNLFLTKWGSTYVSVGVGTSILPLTQAGTGIGALVNTPFAVSGTSITAPAGAGLQGGYIISVSYYQGTPGQTTMRLRLDGAEVSRFVLPNDTAPQGNISFEHFQIIPDNLTHSFDLQFINSFSSAVQLGNVTVSIVKIA